MEDCQFRCIFPSHRFIINNAHSIKQGLRLLTYVADVLYKSPYMHVQISYTCMRIQGFQTKANQINLVSRRCPQLYLMDSVQSANGTLQCTWDKLKYYMVLLGMYNGKKNKSEIAKSLMKQK